MKLLLIPAIGVPRRHSKLLLSVALDVAGAKVDEKNKKQNENDAAHHDARDLARRQQRFACSHTPATSSNRISRFSCINIGLHSSTAHASDLGPICAVTNVGQVVVWRAHY